MAARRSAGPRRDAPAVAPAARPARRPTARRRPGGTAGCCVARSCWPPADECPVTATGMHAEQREAEQRRGPAPGQTANRQPTATTSATNAVSSHAFGCSSSSNRLSSRFEPSTSPTDLPIASASLNATDTSAARHQRTAAQDAVRSAAYAPTSSMPDFLGATMNAANSKRADGQDATDLGEDPGDGQAVQVDHPGVARGDRQQRDRGQDREQDTDDDQRQDAGRRAGPRGRGRRFRLTVDGHASSVVTADSMPVPARVALSRPDAARRPRRAPRERSTRRPRRRSRWPPPGS